MIGGCVYRGSRLPELTGQYIFGDWETRRLWAAPLTEKGLGKHQLLTQTNQRIVDFGEDGKGELYILDYEAGGMYRIVPRPPDKNVAVFPRKLQRNRLVLRPSRMTSRRWGWCRSPSMPSNGSMGATAEHYGRRFPAPQEFASGPMVSNCFPANSVLIRTLSVKMQSMTTRQALAGWKRRCCTSTGRVGMHTRIAGMTRKPTAIWSIPWVRMRNWQLKTRRQATTRINRPGTLPRGRSA